MLPLISSTIKEYSPTTLFCSPVLTILLQQILSVNRMVGEKISVEASYAQCKVNQKCLVKVHDLRIWVESSCKSKSQRQPSVSRIVRFWLGITIWQLLILMSLQTEMIQKIPMFIRHKYQEIHCDTYDENANEVIHGVQKKLIMLSNILVVIIVKLSFEMWSLNCFFCFMQDENRWSFFLMMKQQSAFRLSACNQSCLFFSL